MKKILIALSLVLALSCLTMFAGCSETDDLSGTIAIRNFSVKAGTRVTTFETFGEAWKYANENTSVDVSIICGEDVNAENGKFGEYGELTVTERTGTLTLDLNGHSINRGLTKETARENGCIFYLSDGYSPHITVKNGTLTGGANTENGGAIDDRADHGVFWLDNVTITGNYSAATGGAIYYVSDKNYLCLRDVTVTGNDCTWGGSVYVSITSHTYKGVYLGLYGKVRIDSNNTISGLWLSYSVPGGSKAKYAFYTELDDDIAEGSIRITIDKESAGLAFCIVGGNEQATLRAFKSYPDSVYYHLFTLNGVRCLGTETY